MTVATPAVNPALRYCGFVDPAHPLLDAVFPAGSGREDGRLESALAALSRRTAYRSLPGHHAFDELLAGWSDRSRPLVLNCIDRTCLLVSHLRREGVEPDRVYVVLAGVRRFLQHHAWCLLRDGDAFLWIDPTHLRPHRVSGREVADGFDVYVIFNDRELAFTRDAKRRLLRIAGGPG